MKNFISTYRPEGVNISDSTFYKGSTTESNRFEGMFNAYEFYRAWGQSGFTSARLWFWDRWQTKANRGVLMDMYDKYPNFSDYIKYKICRGTFNFHRQEHGRYSKGKG